MAFALSGLALPAHAETETGLEFSDGFLVGGRTIDMRRYVRGNPMPAGDYRVDVLVNGQYLQTRDITFVAGDDPDRAGACLSADLLRELEQRLAWGGIAVDGTPPVRAFANRSIVSSALVRPDSLAAERQAEALETAIVERRRIELERYATVGSFADSPNGSFRVWPLQLLFHNIGWYLVFEDDAIGTGGGGCQVGGVRQW